MSDHSNAIFCSLFRKSGAPCYELVSSFPKKVFDDDNVTLEDAGLIPNATLHLKPKK
jgi:hypothetical protein